MEALRAVTVNPAWQLHLENEIGMLRTGMRADLVVPTRDPRTVPVERLPGRGPRDGHLPRRTTDPFLIPRAPTQREAAP